MKVLVTGGLGFIGHQVVNNLTKLNIETVIIDNKTSYGLTNNIELNKVLNLRIKKLNKKIHQFDIKNYLAVEKLFKEHNFDSIIHLASFPGQKYVENDPSWASATMIQGLINLLECAKKYNTKRFFFTSSSMVYGDFTDNATEDEVCKPTNLYGKFKLFGENLVKDYSKNSFNYTILRPSAVYGPYDLMNRVIGKFFKNCQEDKMLVVNGEDEKLDFTYIDDVADGIINALLSGNTKNKTYNITYGKSETILHAARQVSKLVGKGIVEIRQKDLSYPSRGALNIELARKDFNYNPKVNLQEGLQKYYEWISNSIFWSEKTI